MVLLVDFSVYLGFVPPLPKCIHGFNLALMVLGCSGTHLVAGNWLWTQFSYLRILYESMLFDIVKNVDDSRSRKYRTHTHRIENDT